MNHHICRVCNKEFKSIRYFVKTCSPKCYRYSNTIKYMKGIQIDEKKIVYKRLKKSFTYDKENLEILKKWKAYE